MIYRPSDSMGSGANFLEVPTSFCRMARWVIASAGAPHAGVSLTGDGTNSPVKKAQSAVPRRPKGTHFATGPYRGSGPVVRQIDLSLVHPIRYD
jgi:hypothetical protein